MKPRLVRVDYDETSSGQFKVTVDYHEGDTADQSGCSAVVVVYVPTRGRLLPQALPEISTTAEATARKFLQTILSKS